jgi:hypothetical protein
MSDLSEFLSTYSSKKEEESTLSVYEYLTNRSTTRKRRARQLSPFRLLIESAPSNTTDPYPSIFSDLQIDMGQLSSSENKVNFNREDYLRTKITAEFLNLLKDEDFEFGYKTRSEMLIVEQLNINALATRNWLNEIFLKYFHDESVVIGILRIIGRFEQEIIFPQGQTIALAALSHESDEIKELGIRAFEKWGTLESLNILKKVKSDSKWLQEYIDQVTFDLEAELCHI